MEVVDLRTILLYQQHPRAQSEEENQDGKMLMEWQERFKESEKTPKIILGTPGEKAQIVADIAMYHQTSMGPQLALEGLQVVQVLPEGGDRIPPHEKDLLIEQGQAECVASAEAFIKVLKEEKETKRDRDRILKALGFQVKEERQKNFEKAFASPFISSAPPFTPP